MKYTQGVPEPLKSDHTVYDVCLTGYTNQEEVDRIDLSFVNVLWCRECTVFPTIKNCKVRLIRCQIFSIVSLLFESNSVYLQECLWTPKLIECLKMPKCKVHRIENTLNYSDFGEFYSVTWLVSRTGSLNSLPQNLEYLAADNTTLHSSIEWPLSLSHLYLNYCKIVGNLKVPKHTISRFGTNMNNDFARYIKAKEISSEQVFLNKHVRKWTSSNCYVILEVVEKNAGIQDYILENRSSLEKSRIDAAIHQNRAIFRAAREATLTWMGLRLILRDVARIIGEFVWESRFEKDIWIDRYIRNFNKK